MADTLTRDERITWMAVWAAKAGLQLQLEGECGFGRECVGVLTDGHYPDYQWHDETTYERADSNGDVWTPPNAYHKADVVAVLGRGEEAERELYDWLRWFDANGFKLETGSQRMDPALGILGAMLGKHRYARMVRQPAVATVDDRLAVLMRRVREDRHELTYSDLQFVQTGEVRHG